MKQNRSGINVLAAGAALGALLLMACVSADERYLPPAQQAGNVSYICGGIGLDESDAMKAAASKHSLALTFTAHIGKRDAYTADVKVTIAGADGKAVLDATCDAPYFLVDLPAGKYKVTAVSGGVSKSQTVDIAAGGHKKVVFAWASTQQE
ncbi:MAG: hypothetical protein P4L83_24980 [Nevskia sp.]|nr:hypothetical protein [Nevskia sp.]